MTRVSKWTSATLAVGLLACVGCPPPPKPIPPQPKPMAWTPPASRAESTAQLEPVTAEFDQEMLALPGSTATDHRLAVLTLLDSLEKILQLANGPDQSPAFTNRLEVVRNARATIAIQTIPRTRMEAAENEALVAAVDALDEVSTRFLFDDPKLPDLVKSARDKIATALKSQGPMHDLDATAAFTAVQTLVREETDAFIDRFGSFDARTRLAMRLGMPAPAPTEPMPAATTMPTTAPTTP